MRTLLLLPAVAALAYGCSGKPITETKTVTIEVTPQACKDALRAADDVINLATDALGKSADALDAASRFDVSAINRTTDWMVANKEHASTLRAAWDRLRDQCAAS